MALGIGVSVVAVDPGGDGSGRRAAEPFLVFGGRLMRGMLLGLFVSVAVAVGADEVVQYRCVDWKSKHLHDMEKATKIVETLEALGCELEKSDHNGHIDVKYRCEEWRQIEPDTHAEAHKWEEWLKEYEFETKHEH